MNLKYSKKVMQNFFHPKNMGEIKNPDGVGKIGNPQCGDVMWIYLKVGKKKIKGKKQEFIKDIKFKTFGCTAAIATSSMITQLAKKQSLEQAEKISMKDIMEELGGLPSIKIHCSQLAKKALNEAIEDYKKKKVKLVQSKK